MTGGPAWDAFVLPRYFCGAAMCRHGRIRAISERTPAFSLRITAASFDSGFFKRKNQDQTTPP